MQLKLESDANLCEWCVVEVIGAADGERVGLTDEKSFVPAVNLGGGSRDRG